MTRKRLALGAKKGYSPDVHWAPEQPGQHPTREEMGLPVPKLAPFGWELRGSVLEPVAEEQMALRQIRLHFAFGASAKEIAHTLNQDGILQDGQHPWSEQAIEELLSYDDEPLWQEWLAREMGEE